MAADKRKNKWLLQLGSITGFVAITFLLTKAYVCPPSQKYDLTYPKELIELAASIGMEPLIGEEFLHNLKIYGGRGLPYAFGVLMQGETPNSRVPASVLFWCQKAGKKYLVYAVDSEEDDEQYIYEVKSILSERELYSRNYDVTGDTARGLIVYDGILGMTKDLAHFSYIDAPSKSGPENIFPAYENGFLPIIIHGESATMVLYHYKGRWLRYIERDV